MIYSSFHGVREICYVRVWEGDCLATTPLPSIISGLRMSSEYAFAGVKRLGSFSQRYRNQGNNLADKFMPLAFRSFRDKPISPRAPNFGS